MIRTSLVAALHVALLFSCGTSKKSETPVESTQPSQENKENTENKESTENTDKSDDAVVDTSEGLALFEENCQSCHTVRMPIQARDFPFIKDTVENKEPMATEVSISDADLQKVVDYLNNL